MRGFPERALRRIDRGLRDVRERFLGRLDGRLARIRGAVARVPGDPEAVAALGNEIHALIGAAGTLGFHDLAAAAEGVDRTSRGEPDPSATDAALVVLYSCVEAYVRRRTAA